ncbi:unnamed protein product [Closterium sp. Yama58-4]|nr:unnamed protein product [Closterium sp. Yama58-4]
MRRPPRPSSTAISNLPEGRASLEWSKRMRVAAGAAKGLEYLHEEASPPVIYRDAILASTGYLYTMYGYDNGGKRPSKSDDKGNGKE